MSSDWIIIDVLTKGLGFSLKRAKNLSMTRSVHAMTYRKLKHLVLRRDIGDYYEGTVVIKTNEGYKVIPGYPRIKRMVLPRAALDHRFTDKIIVEEKMNGYNIRVFKIRDNIYAATRGIISVLLQHIK